MTNGAGSGLPRSLPAHRAGKPIKPGGRSLRSLAASFRGGASPAALAPRRLGYDESSDENVWSNAMIVSIAHPLPTPANENANPLHKASTALLELHRLRRKLVQKDKTGYSPDQWQRYHAALKQADEALRLLQPYL